MRKLLIDTSVIIDFLRRKKKQDTLFYSLAEHELYCSIISHTELYSGMSVWERKEAKKELEDLFSGIKIIPLQKEVSEKAGNLKALRPQISLIDCIIGASAIVHDLTLVTLNTKDFEKFEKIQLFSE